MLLQFAFFINTMSWWPFCLSIDRLISFFLIAALFSRRYLYQSLLSLSLLMAMRCFQVQSYQNSVMSGNYIICAQCVCFSRTHTKKWIAGSQKVHIINSNSVRLPSKLALSIYTPVGSMCKYLFSHRLSNINHFLPCFNLHIYGLSPRLGVESSLRARSWQPHICTYPLIQRYLIIGVQ